MVGYAAQKPVLAITGGMKSSFSFSYSCIARPICLKLLTQMIFWLDSRTFFKADKTKAPRTPSMAITTKSSTSVNAIAFPKALNLGGNRKAVCLPEPLRAWAAAMEFSFIVEFFTPALKFCQRGYSIGE
ncbi:MAG: hypothetical protein PHV34_02400 [Verrucomicrobiae bacterium]|nr:hypothetical protein [Verrucomicrobiae bacterium]